MKWYVFMLVEAEVDKDGLGPTYRLVGDLESQAQGLVDARCTRSGRFGA